MAHDRGSSQIEADPIKEMLVIGEVRGFELIVRFCAGLDQLSSDSVVRIVAKIMPIRVHDVIGAGGQNHRHAVAILEAD